MYISKLAEGLTEEMIEAYHYPVMNREVLSLLKVKGQKVVVDCTLGLGCHAYMLLEAMKEITLIGIDKDNSSLEIARKRLKPFMGRFTLVKEDFINVDKVLKNLAVPGADMFLFDLGISTYQLSDPKRGFSFLKEGPLDMRMDEDFFLSAYDLVNNLSEEELGNIFRKYGEERYSKRIAHFLAQARKSEPVSTTVELAKIITEAVPVKNRYDRIHPATRVFQALRIAVNRELEILEEAFTKAISLLNKEGKIGVISFHSLEDRIAKHTFRSCVSKGVIRIINKKPLVPSDLEKEENPASRSAKLRAAEKI